MGSAAKRDRRAANYQERQRRTAADAKAEKDRQKQIERDAAHYANGGQYANGGLIAYNWYGAPQQYTVAPGNWYVTSGSGPAPSRSAEPLPKSESTELRVGYRIWPLSRSYPDGYRLSAMNSCFYGTINPNQKLEAVCQADGDRVYFTSPQINAMQNGGSVTVLGDDTSQTPLPHIAPHEGCHCGIHAYSTSVPLEPSDKPYAAGEVYLWGRVIEHEKGFRAQYAYPKRLVVVDGGPRAQQIAIALELTYGVPCSVWDG